MIAKQSGHSSRNAQQRAQSFGKVAVVMGGWAAEREVSLMSGQQVFEALSGAGVDVHPVDAERDVVTVLQQGDFDRAFLILHGRGGEDGHVQGALELAGIPYTGTGVLGSALCMDKMRSKELCSVHGIPVAKAERIDSAQAAREAADRIGLPLVIKPILEGSSIGVSMVQRTQQIEPAYRHASEYGAVMMEQCLTGSEITCAVLRHECLPLVSIEPADGFYDYDAKYVSSETLYGCPAKLAPGMSARVQSLALRAFDALGCDGWARVDFMLDTAGEPYFMECNTAPGMTSHSLVPIAAREAGLDFSTLCLEILATSIDTGGEAS